MVTHSSFFLLSIVLIILAAAVCNDQSLSTVVVVEAFSSPQTTVTTTPRFIIMRQQQHKSSSSSRQHKNKAGNYNILQQATSADDNEQLSQQQEQVAVKSAYKENLDEEADAQQTPPSSSIAAASTSPPPPPPPSSLQEIALLVFPLLLIYISNQWSRYSISYLVDFSSTANDVASSTATATATATTATAFTAMNIDLQFTKSQYGLLASTAFTILFALSSLIAGNLADKYNRKTLTLVSSSIWIISTLYSSSVHTYNEVLIARIIMGGACAFAAPVAYTLIADKISNDKLALSNSFYGSGVYLGGALSSLSLVLDTSIGWRGTLGVIGVFGIVSVIVGVVLLPSDDDRVRRRRDGTADDDVVVVNTMDSSQDGDEIMAAAAVITTTTTTTTTTNRIEEEETNFINNIGQILSIPRVQYIFIASFFRFCAGLLIGVWAAPYFKQAFPDDATQYAVVNAFIVGGVGMTSGIMGGYIADGLGMWIKNGYNNNIGEATSFGNEEGGGDVGVMMSSPPPSSSRVSSILRDNFDEETIRLLLPIVGSLLAIPAWYQTTHAGAKFEASMFWLAVEYLVAECWFGPTIAVLQSTVGASRTGTAQGLFVLTGALANSAPTLLGWIYGNKVIDTTTASSSEVLANLLSLGVCTGYLLSSVFFLISINSAKQSGRGGLERIAQNADEDSSL